MTEVVADDVAEELEDAAAEQAAADIAESDLADETADEAQAAEDEPAPEVDEASEASAVPHGAVVAPEDGSMPGRATRSRATPTR